MHSRSPEEVSVVAWDLPTRLFKWLLVAGVADAWASNKYGADYPAWHKWNGTAVLVLVVFRLLWGVWGGSTARFRSFVAAPGATLAYALGELRGRAARYLGHNPLGGWMVLAFLAAIGTQAVLGLYSADEDRIVIEGPLARTVSDSAVDRAAHFHRIGFNVILALVVIHVAANLVHDLVRKDGLIRAMMTGRKPRAAYADMAGATPGSALAAIACLAGAIAIVFGGIFALGGDPFR